MPEARDGPMAHVGIVFALAKRYCWSERSREELLAVGNLALLKFWERYDPTKGAKVSTYLWLCISGRMRNWMRDHAASRKADRETWDSQDGRGRADPLSLEDAERLLARENRLEELHGIPTMLLFCDEARAAMRDAGLTREERDALMDSVERWREEPRPGDKALVLQRAQAKMREARRRQR